MLNEGEAETVEEEYIYNEPQPPIPRPQGRKPKVPPPPPQQRRSEL